MRTICSLAFAAILSLMLSLPAFAQHSNGENLLNTNRMNNYGTSNTMNDQMYDYGTTNTRSNMYTNNTNAGTYSNNTNSGMYSNNYRTNAATNNRGTNWSWLGLLGLAGLFGLRSRDRERT